mgnify:CR=1 FL=1
MRQKSPLPGNNRDIYGAKTTGLPQYAATLTNKQDDTDHQPASAPAPQLYLILQKPMMEITLCPQFKQFWPINSVLTIENAMISTNNVIVKLAYIK